jgi:hypothetical protein
LSVRVRIAESRRERMGTTVMLAAVGSSSEMACRVSGGWVCNEEVLMWLCEWRNGSGRRRTTWSQAAVYPPPSPFPKEGG